MQILLDNSAISALSCRRRFQLTVIKGLHTQPTPELALGSAFHTAVELVDKGRTQEEAYKLALEANPKADAFKLLETLTYFLLTDYKDFPPPITLPNGQPAVEVKFSYSLGKIIRPNGKEINVSLAGTIDRMHIDESKLVVLDYKTTSIASDYGIKGITEDYSMAFQLPFYVYALTQAKILSAEHQVLLDTHNYRTEIKLVCHNYKPVKFKSVMHGAFNDEFLFKEVPLIINTKVSEAVEIAELDSAASHDGMTVYKACNNCAFRPACLVMGTFAEDEFLSRFDKRQYNPLTFR